MKPSELQEGQWIRLVTDGGAVVFHEHYGTLYTAAVNVDADPTDVSKGLLLTTEPAEADALYERYQDHQHVLVESNL